MRKGGWAIWGLAMVLAGCTNGLVGVGQESVVYGSDDRRDVYEETDASLQQLTRDSIVAIISPEYLDVSNPDDVQIVGAQTLGADFQLCSGQRYMEQPSAGHCSATLIDDDLVLTAGHCFTDQNHCRQFRFVFNYFYESAGTLATITSDDVYSCRNLLVRREEDLHTEVHDYAIVQLDRPVIGHSPAPVIPGDNPISMDAQLTIIGFGSGIPAKIDSGIRILDPRADTLDHFLGTPDSFGGNSGSGVFDSSGNVVGILVSGEEDYTEMGGCYVVNELPEDCTGCIVGGESITYPARAVGDLCAMSFPSERLCGNAGSCGDGTCAGTETTATCSEDCGASSCGDGVCNADEDAASCAADCASGGGVSIPEAWACPDGFYGAGDGCDCECGALDPDCSSPVQEVYGCEPGQSCGGEGTCQGEASPGEWQCDPSWFGGADGCDCGCGAPDPDCEDATQEVYGCDDGVMCVAGVCDGEGGGGGDGGGGCSTATRRSAPLGIGLIVCLGLGLLLARRRH